MVILGLTHWETVKLATYEASNFSTSLTTIILFRFFSLKVFLEWRSLLLLRAHHGLTGLWTVVSRWAGPTVQVRPWERQAQKEISRLYPGPRASSQFFLPPAVDNESWNLDTAFQAPFREARGERAQTLAWEHFRSICSLFITQASCSTFQSLGFPGSTMGTVLFPGGVTVGFIQINDKSEDAAQSLPLSTCSINVFSSLWVNGEKKKKRKGNEQECVFSF